MKDFKKRFDGGQGGSYPRKDFGNKPRFGGGYNNRDDRGSFGAPQMHQATCSACNASCELPFRPNGKRPVFCKACFGKSEMGGGKDFGNRDFVKRDFSTPAPRQDAPTKNDPRIDELKRSIAMLDSKIDRIVSMLGGVKATQAAPVAEAKKEVSAPKEAPIAAAKPAKKAKKTTTKKKQR